METALSLLLLRGDFAKYDCDFLVATPATFAIDENAVRYLDGARIWRLGSALWRHIFCIAPYYSRLLKIAFLRGLLLLATHRVDL